MADEETDQQLQARAHRVLQKLNHHRRRYARLKSDPARDDCEFQLGALRHTLGRIGQELRRRGIVGLADTCDTAAT